MRAFLDNHDTLWVGLSEHEITTLAGILNKIPVSSVNLVEAAMIVNFARTTKTAILTAMREGL